jgi:hypothetical protein
MRIEMNVVAWLMICAALGAVVWVVLGVWWLG